ncbi:hypothetical protein [Mariprofundus ferrooxydans]|uniref:Kinase n=1 Tax=Mariprofundus ferrooxydans PV-1 TaxID=314345 RepID=Q0EWT0_9PROT|nr:hypothetical protein [Mariprofundus ferrooxydans]EAU53709.1 hypothetical protein SPV1_06204 [Mariprofundus ferrooxydans PV-1]KON48528.1 hypothetical protein AL013_02565 [Mariprofundus ferrooxydans]
MSSPATCREADDLLTQFVRDHRLPDEYRQLAAEYWLPLSNRLASMFDGHTLVVGINGAQGTGKSTMAAALAMFLGNLHDLKTVVISIDDLYLTRAERSEMARVLHPMFQTRGVPGTHDLRLAMALIRALKAAGSESDIAIPRFDKAVDDRRPEAAWHHHHGRVDIILFEGWCVGTTAEPATQLKQPINRLEADEDAQGIWRSHVNASLAGEYSQLNAMIDFLVLLQAPDFETVYAWRGLQEEKLRASMPDGTHLMDQSALTRFIQHYERLTRHNLATLPQMADVVFSLDKRHCIRRARYREGVS